MTENSMNCVFLHIYQHFVEAKTKAWEDDTAEVHPWEVDRHLARY